MPFFLKRIAGAMLYVASKYITRNAFKMELGRWYKNGGDIQLVNGLSLRENSIVFEVGGYTGAFCDRLLKICKPRLYVFEPIKEYFSELQRRYGENSNVILLNIGLSDQTKNLAMMKCAESSSCYSKGDESTAETVEMVDVYDFVIDEHIKGIDLLSINIEGGEYGLLRRIIDTSLFAQIDTLQVQFHRNVDGYGDMRDELLMMLSDKFEVVYSYPYVWERFKRK